ncbi:MAG: hypothetical protein AAGH17_05640 [Pseudomonadota bacterium]
MAGNTNLQNSGNTGLAFIVGAPVVLVGGLLWYVLSGQQQDANDVTISVEGVGEAAQAIEDAVTPAE